MRPSHEIRTAVVGCGYWGKNLVRNFAQLSDLQACCDVSSAVRARLGAQYPNVRITDDFGEILEDPGIEAVVLATPAPSHAELAVDALEAGKDVLVEKPLALTVTDAERMVQLAQARDRILMVGHLLEYHPAVTYLKQLIDRGELGEVLYCYSQRVNLGKLRENENALWSLAPHDISVALYLLDEEPEEVEVAGQAFLQSGVEDVSFLTMKFGSGRMAHVHVSWLDPHKVRRLTVVGSKKMAVFDDMESREKIRIFDKGVDRSPTSAGEYDSYGEALTLRDGDILIPALPNDEPLGLECRAFLEAVQTRTPPLADGHDGLRVVKVLERAQEALARHTLLFGGAPAS